MTSALTSRGEVRTRRRSRRAAAPSASARRAASSQNTGARPSGLPRSCQRLEHQSLVQPRGPGGHPR
jgi:hypothetical protein